MQNTLKYVYKHAGIYMKKKKKPRRSRPKTSTKNMIHDKSNTTDERSGSLTKALYHVPLPRRKRRTSLDGDAQARSPSSVSKFSDPAKKKAQKSSSKNVRKAQPEVIDLTQDNELKEAVEKLNSPASVTPAPKRKKKRHLPRQLNTVEFANHVLKRKEKRHLPWTSNNPAHCEKRRKAESVATKAEQKRGEMSGVINLTQDNEAENHATDGNLASRFDHYTPLARNGNGQLANVEMDLPQSYHGSNSDVIEEANEIYNLFEARIKNIQLRINDEEDKSIFANAHFDNDKSNGKFLQHFSDLFIEQQAFRDDVDEVKGDQLANLKGAIVRVKKALIALENSFGNRTL